MTSISFRRGRFTVQAFIEGRRRSFGTFATREEAEEVASTVVAPDMRRRRVDMAERLLAKSTPAVNGCRIWNGSIDRQGYGRISTQRPGRVTIPSLAHRESYLAFVGPLIDGLTIDHTCHNIDPTCPGASACRHRRCIEPTHLQQVSREVNNRRARERTSGARRNGEAVMRLTRKEKA